MKRKQIDKKDADKVYVKPIKDKKRDIFLAYFWKYGYWFAMTFILIIWGNESNHMLILGMAMIIYGIYSIIISIKPARHFVVASLEGSQQGRNKYAYTRSYDDIKEIKREALFGSIFAILIGLFTLIVTYW